MADSVYEVARCRWLGVLKQLGGLDDTTLSGKHVPCPICGGKDRFRFRDRDGSGDWFCSHCKSGNGMDLLLKVTGMSFREAAPQVEKACGKIEPTKEKRGMSDPSKVALLTRIWNESRPLAEGDIGWTYLRNRGLPAAALMGMTNIRVHPKLEYRDHDGKVIGHYPGIIQRVLSPTGEGLTLHRTYLTTTGEKAPVEEVKKCLPGKVRSGGAVRLKKGATCLGIAEGLETALAASLLFQVPVWPCLDTHGVETFDPPEGVEEVVIFADNDPNYAGHKAAYTCAYRLAQRGIKVTLQFPKNPGEDWLDHYVAVARIWNVDPAGWEVCEAPEAV